MTQSSGDYFINQELMEEMVRLKRQAGIVTSEMGGALWEQQEPNHIHRVLDLACGPGEWAMEVANTYSHIEQVIGVDKSQRMISYANAQAEAEGSKASFRVMDITQPLDFPNGAFDLINARFIHSLMKADQWPMLLQECFRVLCPGGILRMTEQESGFSNDKVYQQYIDLWGTAWIRSGHSFSHSHSYIGVTVVLKDLMHQAGLIDQKHRPISIDLSSRQPIHREMIENLAQALKLAGPFLLRVGAGTQKDITELYEQMESLIGKEHFCAYWLLQTIWASKPQNSEV